MRRTVLRGDYTRLRRRGNRVWVRYRPDEIVWRTSHAFRVEDIHSIKTGVFRFERRRRSRVHGLVPSRVVQSAITRVTFEYGDGGGVVIDLFETEATVEAAFQDVLDRLGGGNEPTRSAIVDDATHARVDATRLRPIFWRADPDPVPDIDLPAVQPGLWEGDVLPAELGRDVSFHLDLGVDPHAVGQWALRQLRQDPEDEQLNELTDDWFGNLPERPDAVVAPSDTVRVRKRRRRRQGLRRHHS
jgi:hypothetical protein